jgi:hypothetical protein
MKKQKAPDYVPRKAAIKSVLKLAAALGRARRGRTMRAKKKTGAP